MELNNRIFHGSSEAMNYIDYSCFSRDEKTIIEIMSSRDWYVTRAEKLEEKTGEQCLKAILVKPQERVREAFNLQREVIVLFSPYNSLDMRSLNNFDSMNIEGNRAEEICSILISRDPDVQKLVDKVLKTKKESRIVIPFTYEELLSVNNPDFIIRRIHERFYSRDLFGFQEALTEDRFFFGRKDLIYELANQHLTGSCSGVFGLRKTGKTSILYSLQRTLDRKQSIPVYIDCMTLHNYSWNGAIYAIISKVVESCFVKRSTIHSADDYKDESGVALLLQADLEAVFIANKKKSILLIFDEIENITFGTSPSEQWQSGKAFIKFWQTLRSVFQILAPRHIFTYLIAGTNPRCIEQAIINKTDNPIFAQFQPHYIPPFTFDTTTEMVSTLGGYMGLIFDDPTINQLVSDFGGQPLLMRQQCSYIHRQIGMDTRPFRVTLEDYIKCRDSFYKESGGFIQYADMILGVLKNWYELEYDMLELLANGQVDDFVTMADDSPDLVAHLLNYGIIGCREGAEYYFNIVFLKQYIKKNNTHNVTQIEDKIKVFISYSHDDDKKWLSLLLKHFEAASNTFSSKIEVWHDEQIMVGERWDSEIKNHIETANIAILLISTSYLASSYVQSDELPSLLRKKQNEDKLFTVIPVIVSPCLFDLSPLSEFQSINSPDKTLAELETPALVDRVFLKIMAEVNKKLK